MQIHELNNYSGTLGSGTFLAIDDGNDTGKITTAKLLSKINEDLSDAVDTLNGRIDNIIAGDPAPSEAEIIDARYGADGVSYPSLGDAIRTNDQKLNEKILFNEGVILEKITFTYNNYDGKYINHGGGLSTDNSTHTSDVIEIPEGASRIFFNNVTPETGFYCFGFYSNDTPSNTSDVLIYQYTSSNLDDFYVDIPVAAKYFIYSYLAADSPGDVYFFNSESVSGITPLQTTFFENKNLFDIMADNLVGSYYDATNVLKTSSSYGQSDLIPVSEGEKYSTPETGFFVNCYDSNGDFVGNIPSTTFLSQGYIEPLAGSSYARFMFTISAMGDFYVKCVSTSIPVLNSKYLPAAEGDEDNNPYKGLNAVAFGTSITYKARTTGGYLQYLPSLSGITFDNQGVGSSAILNPPGALNMLETIKNYASYSDKNIVTIEGFVNDWYGQKTLGTYKDATEDTVCGCLRSAINYIYSQNANMTLFVIFDHYGRNYNGANESSTAVRNGLTQYEFYEEMAKVCESLGVKVVKLYAMSEMSELTPQYFLDDIHPNGLGAKQTANNIWAVMKAHMPNQKA